MFKFVSFFPFEAKSFQVLMSKNLYVMTKSNATNMNIVGNTVSSYLETFGTAVLDSNYCPKRRVTNILSKVK